MPHATSRCAGRQSPGSRWFSLIATTALALCCAARVDAEDLTPGKSLDKVIVAGKPASRSDVRQALLDSEARFNARYNELNKDDDYDIVCRDETPTDSHIPRRVCEAKIVDEMTAREAHAYFFHDASIPLTPPDVVRRQAMFELKERTLALAQSDPELMRDLLEHSALERMYSKLKEERSK